MLVSDLQLQHSWRYCLYICISIALLPPPIPPHDSSFSFPLSSLAGSQSSNLSKRLLISFSNARIDPSYLSLPNLTPTDIDFVTSIAVICCSAAHESEVAAGFESCSQIQPTRPTEYPLYLFRRLSLDLVVSSSQSLPHSCSSLSCPGTCSSPRRTFDFYRNLWAFRGESWHTTSGSCWPVSWFATWPIRPSRRAGLERKPLKLSLRQHQRKKQQQQQLQRRHLLLQLSPKETNRRRTIMKMRKLPQGQIHQTLDQPS